MGKEIWLFLGWFWCLWTLAISRNSTVEQKLKDDPDLSLFYELLIGNEASLSPLKNRQITIFAPTNAAFQRYTGKLDEALVLYHITSSPLTSDKLGTVLRSYMDGGPPLFVTHRKSLNHDDIFINNAKILLSHSNYVGLNNNKRQVLHVIDEVLTPVVSSQTSNNQLFDPDAYQFLFQTESLDIGAHRMRVFRQKVNQTGKSRIFKNEGRHTFFIPVDDGFSKSPRADLLDEKVIDSHVIPNHVLFTASASYDTSYETLAFGDNLKVTVSFATDNLNSDGDKSSKVFVMSNTVLGDPNHATGVVQTEIVKANIPVRNGVVHLIQRPLMIVDMKLYEVFEMMKDDGPLFKFYQVMMDIDAGRQFFSTLKRLQGGTIFAPSNTAWQDDNIRNLILNEDKMREILNMHLVTDQRLSVEKIRQNIQNQVPTSTDRKSLYFNVIMRDNAKILTVEGGGVNATVVLADVAATNGVIHIIDKVLGVPHTTVYEKLRTDPMLNDTFILGKQRNFNRQLNDTTRRFTYFVPRDKAWRKTEVTQPSTLKKLFMSDYSYHAVQILERHLVISDRPYTMERLKQMASMSPTNEVDLPSVRDNLRIRIEEKDKSVIGDEETQNRSSFTVIWRNEKIHVFRPDVECTNGVIHVIDLPFLQEGDVRVTGSANSIAVTVTAHCFMLAIVKWLLL